MRAVWLERALHVVVLLGLAFLCIGYARTPPEDLRGYLAAGNAVIARRDIYGSLPAGVNTWPPFFSLLCAPLALFDRFSDFLLRYFWAGLNFGALILALDLVSRAVFARSIASVGERKNAPFGFFQMFVPLILTLPYVVSNLEHQQVSILIFSLVLAGLILEEKGRPALGALALGLVIAMKIMPAIFLFYWAYRQRWRAAILGTIAALAFSASPILIYGGAQFRRDVAAWFSVVRRGWGAGSLNLSPLAMLDRMIGHKLVPFLSPGVEHLDYSGVPIVRILWIFLLMTIGFLCFLSFRREKGPGVWGTRAEWSAVFLFSALAGPVMWKHYLVVALLGNATLWGAWLSRTLSARGRREIPAILTVCFMMSLPMLPDWLGQSLIRRLEMSSIVTDAGLLLLCTLLWFRFRVGDLAESRES